MHGVIAMLDLVNFEFDSLQIGLFPRSVVISRNLIMTKLCLSLWLDYLVQNVANWATHFRMIFL